MTSRCSPSRFSNVVKNFNENQREAVKSIGFGNLLKLNDIRLRRTLINWLIERYCPQTRSFFIGKHEIQVTKMDIALIMGLRVTGKPVDPKIQTHSVDHLMTYYKARCGQIDVKCLEVLLQTTDSTDDFKRTFVLFALCTLLAPKPRPEVSATFLQCVMETEKISTYAWGEFTLENLFSELDTYKREGHKYIGGCVVLLQFWYYEHIRVSAEGSSSLPKKFPRLSEWDGSRCLDRDKKEGYLGGYGLGEVVEHISPTPIEATNEEVKLLLAEVLPISSKKVLERKIEEADDSVPSETKLLQNKSLVVVAGDVNLDKQVAEAVTAAAPIAKNATADAQRTKEEKIVALKNEINKAGQSIARCTKKRKIAPDILHRIDALEHLLEEQRNGNEGLLQRLYTMERALQQNDHDRNIKESRIVVLEHAIEEQKQINEELRQSLIEIQRMIPQKNCDENQNERNHAANK